MTALLAVHALDAFYGDFQALFGVDFELGRGEAVAVIGANGAGKSTLLKSMAGLLRNRRDAIRLFDGARSATPRRPRSCAWGSRWCRKAGSCFRRCRWRKIC